MSYCINPHCLKPNDPANVNSRVCRNCGSDLLIQGRYQVMRLLNDYSGFGKIYEAYEGETPKILKILKQDHNANATIVKAFQQEAAVLSQLNHPGLPKVKLDGYFEFFPHHSTEPIHCIVMEKIDGPNLKQWMKQQGYHPIADQQALNWLKQLAEILHLIHQQSYFHRDIKPDNIMIRPNGQLVLIDFGTAREVTYTYLLAVSGGGSVTKIGSAGYTPPEQEKGYAVPQSDFYALGRTFVYLLTGKTLTNQALYEPNTDELYWREYAPQISVKLADFIDRLMAHKAAERPKNTQEILDTLDNLSQELSQDRISPNPSESITTQSFLKIPIALNKFVHPPKKWLVGGTVALMMGLGGYGIWKIDKPYIFQINPTEHLSTLKTLAGHASFINCLLFSTDGKILVSGSGDNTIKVWNLETGQAIRTFKGHYNAINSLAISPDRQILASASADKTIKVWNLATGQELRTLKGHSNFVNYLVISPDGQILVSASADKTIKIWNLVTGQTLHTLKSHSSFVNALAISPDGKLLASGSADKTIKIWNLETGQEIRTLTGHSSFVNYLVISPDGRKLFSASADKTIKIWNLDTGQEIRTLTGHSSFVNYLVISPDGQTLTSGSIDDTIKIWDLSNRQKIRTLKGNFNYVNYLAISPLAISPDGQRIATGSGDKTIKIWRVPR